MVDLKRIYDHVFELEYKTAFRSYDIYDGSGIQIPGLRKLRTARLISTYFNKYFPVNTRACLGISKRKYPHAVACMVEAYYTNPVSSIPEEAMYQEVDWLISISLKSKYGYHCWSGLGIPVDMKNQRISPSVPGVIGTSAVTRALAAYYEKSGDQRIPEILRSVRHDLLSNYFHVESQISFFRYKPDTPPWLFVINASAKAASLICRINHVLQESCGNDKVLASVMSILDVQEKSGRWKYHLDLKQGHDKDQSDFHQAYIVKALLDIHESKLIDIPLERAIQHGINYQNITQLREDGALYYRFPRKYPVNIHNQLYAYYVNRAAAFLDPNYSEKAVRILNWTFRNLYNSELGFIYGLYPGLKIRISYSRWGNAHALYLFSLLNFPSEKLLSGWT